MKYKTHWLGQTGWTLCGIRANPHILVVTSKEEATCKRCLRLRIVNRLFWLGD
jgi:hypothetical protein